MRLLIILVFTLIACDKGGTDEPPTPPPTPSDTQSVAVASNLKGSWRLSAQTSSVAIDFDNNGSKETDLFAVQDSCTRALFFIFGTYPDLTKVNEAGRTYCGYLSTTPPTPKKVEKIAEWQVYSNGTKFKWRIYDSANPNALYGEYTFGLSGNTFTLSSPTDFPQGTSFVKTTITYTYTKQ